MHDIIIIGGGPAGLTAATYACRAGMEVLILEAAVCGGQIVNSMNVENFPGIKNIPGWQLASQWQDQAVSLGAQLKTASVTGIEDLGDKKLVHTSKGDLEAKAVIVAAGAGHRRLECPGAEEFTGRGISTCANCDGAFYRGNAVCVVGGGNSAFEDALYLSSICPTVYLVNRRAQFRADPETVEKVTSLPNVEILTPYVAHEVHGEGRVSSFSVKNTETGEIKTLPVIGIFTAIGMIPSSGPFSSLLELDDSGYIITDDHCRTNVPGIFAAGDITKKHLRQLVTAASDGAVSATEAVRYVNNLR